MPSTDPCFLFFLTVHTVIFKHVVYINISTECIVLVDVTNEQILITESNVNSTRKCRCSCCSYLFCFVAV